MKIKEIRKRIEYIQDISGDDEAAHSAEDDLHIEFIESLAQRKDSLGEKARLILTTQDIDFCRFCA